MKQVSAGTILAFPSPSQHHRILHPLGLRTVVDRDSGDLWSSASAGLMLQVAAALIEHPLTGKTTGLGPFRPKVLGQFSHPISLLAIVLMGHWQLSIPS